MPKPMPLVEGQRFAATCYGLGYVLPASYEARPAIDADVAGSSSTRMALTRYEHSFAGSEEPRRESGEKRSPHRSPSFLSPLPLHRFSHLPLPLPYAPRPPRTR